VETEEIKKIIETLLFISEKPLTLDRVIEVIDKDLDKKSLHALLDELIAEYQERTFHIREVAGGYQLCTRPEYGEWVKNFLKIERRTRLSRAALVTLAIIAYKQPITRVEIEEIRRVDVSGIVKGLMEKRLIKMVGRKKVPGKPIMYGTTKEFLEYFGLKELSDLPRKEEFLSLYENEMDSPQKENNKEESKEAELFDSVPDDPS
jgi:segregation and condensation protein B